MFEKFWLFMDRNKAQIGIAFTFVAAIFTLQQYLVSRHDGRVARSLSHVDRLESGKNSAARLYIEQFMLAEENRE